MKQWAFVLAFLALASCASAQTASYTASWDHTVAPAVVATYTYTLSEDSSVPADVTPTCAAAGAGTHCTAPVPAALVTLLTPGLHTFVLTAHANGLTASSDPYSYSPPVAPGKPTSFSITFTVTVP